MQPKFSIISSLNQALHGCRFSINSPLILTEIRHFEKKKKSSIHGRFSNSVEHVSIF